MSSSGAEEGAYQVRNSALIAQTFYRLQRQATREGRGQALLDATRQAYRRLQKDPFEFGEPLYRLPGLRMQVRCGAIRPLAIDFAVSEDWPLVFIKEVRLLSLPG